MRRTPENRAEMLALALGVNPKHDQQRYVGVNRECSSYGLRNKVAFMFAVLFFPFFF